MKKQEARNSKIILFTKIETEILNKYIKNYILDNKNHLAKSENSIIECYLTIERTRKYAVSIMMHLLILKDETTDIHTAGFNKTLALVRDLQKTDVDSYDLILNYIAYQGINALIHDTLTPLLTCKIDTETYKITKITRFNGDEFIQTKEGAWELIQSPR